jgi:hypothetical protein
MQAWKQTRQHTALHPSDHTHIKPHVELLQRVLLSNNVGRDLNSPVQIARDAPGLQTLVDPRLCDADGVGAPGALLTRTVEPLDQGLLKSVQLEVQVLRLALLGGGTVELAAGVDEPAGGLGGDVVVGLGGALLGLGLEGIEQVSALVALVAAGVGVSAQAALALDEAVGEELAVNGAVGLGRLALLDESVIPEPGRFGLATVVRRKGQLTGRTL